MYSVRMSSLREQLVADGEYFKYMLNMIPGGYCVDSVQNTVTETHSSRSTGGMWDSSAASSDIFCPCKVKLENNIYIFPLSSREKRSTCL